MKLATFALALVGLMQMLMDGTLMASEPRKDFLNEIKLGGIDFTDYSSNRGIVWVRKDMSVPFSLTEEAATALKGKLNRLRFGQPLLNAIEAIGVAPDEIWIDYGTEKKITTDSIPQGVILIYLESKLSTSGSAADVGARGAMLRFDATLKLYEINPTLLTPRILQVHLRQ